MPWRSLQRWFRKWQRSQERSRLWRISRRLDPASLVADDVGDDELFIPEDFLRAEQREASHFLGYYSRAGLRHALREYGLWERFEQLCEGEPTLEIADTTEAFHRLRLCDLAGGPPLVEVRAGLHRHRGLRWLYIDWMLLQHPGRDFSEQRPRLPGQDHPGLRAGHAIMEILLIMAHRLECDGVMGRPARFHNAWMYRGHFRFEDPLQEGLMRATLRAMGEAGLGLAEAAWAIEDGRLREQHGDEPVIWEPGRILAPLHPSAEYQDPTWEQQVQGELKRRQLYFKP